MTGKPEVTVAAVVERAGKFLLIEERIDGRLVLNQPAGHVEPGETLLEAVVRETFEESAWRFRPQHLLGAYRWTNTRRQRATLRFAFCGEVSEHHPLQRLDVGIVRALWLDRAAVVRRAHAHRTPLVMRCIEDYLFGKRLPLAAVADFDLERAASDQPFGVHAVSASG
jgi:8-oxo-dGTP pyrophosphatase MutT (NUDIX family)